MCDWRRVSVRRSCRWIGNSYGQTTDETGIMDHRITAHQSIIHSWSLHHRTCPCPRCRIPRASFYWIPNGKADGLHAALILISFQALDRTSGFIWIASSTWATLGDNKLYDTGRRTSETCLLPECDFVIALEGRTSNRVLAWPLATTPNCLLT